MSILDRESFIREPGQLCSYFDDTFLDTTEKPILIQVTMIICSGFLIGMVLKNVINGYAWFGL